MKKMLLVCLCVWLVLIFGVSASAQVLDPAREHEAELVHLGIDLNSLETRVQKLAGGDEKIWYIYEESSYESYACSLKEKGLEDLLERNNRLYGDTWWIEWESVYVIAGSSFDGVLVRRILFPDLLIFDSDIKGDVDGNQEVDMRDVLIMRQNIAGQKHMYLIRNADYNDDGFINMKDVLGVRKKLIQT